MVADREVDEFEARLRLRCQRGRVRPRTAADLAGGRGLRRDSASHPAHAAFALMAQQVGVAILDAIGRRGAPAHGGKIRGPHGSASEIPVATTRVGPGFRFPLNPGYALRRHELHGQRSARAKELPGLAYGFHAFGLFALLVERTRAIQGDACLGR